MDIKHVLKMLFGVKFCNFLVSVARFDLIIAFADTLALA